MSCTAVGHAPAAGTAKAGTPVDLEYAAALYNGNGGPGGSGGPDCSGTVLPSGMVLTAAHCGAIIRVKVGGRTLGVEACRRHHGFKKLTKENDVALVELAGKPEDLPSIDLAADAAWEASAQSVRFAGFGIDCHFGKRSCQADVALVNRQSCRKAYKITPFSVTELNLCTSTKVAGVDPADSGGPVTAAIQGEDRLVGVIGTGFALGFPDRHARVTEYREWIDKVESGDFAETEPCGS